MNRKWFFMVVWTSLIVMLIAVCTYGQQTISLTDEEMPSKVGLTWNESATPGCTYFLYLIPSDTNQSASVVDCGTDTTVVVAGLGKGFHTAYVKASLDKVLSAASNTVQFEMPGKPEGDVTLVLQSANTLEGPWKDVQFFKLKVEQ